MSHIIFYTKPPGQRSAGKPHAALDAAGAGNVAMVAGLRAVAKAAELPPEPKVRAPVLDPTCERLQGRFLRPTHQLLFWR
jgi:hypothetical protein